MMNKKLMWIVIVIVVLAFIYKVSYPQIINSQSLIPQCFEKEDCRIPVKQGYCSAKYDCIQGKCYSSNVLCKETCDNGKDDDRDGNVDCSDTDCWNSPLCPCANVNFNECSVGRCWCPIGDRPRWYVSGEGKSCVCI